VLGFGPRRPGGGISWPVGWWGAFAKWLRGLVAKNRCISIFPSLGGNKDYSKGLCKK
jgi:hypothetical protein